ncbi:MAG: class sortase, partial [Conexibacter sp.]|nr:class sortase [Conexibacter sp.]
MVAHTEYAGGGPGYALVRLTGAARSETPARLAPPTLLVADGAQWRRLAAVPGTPVLHGTPDGAPFAVAFEIPLHLALGDGAWWLEPGPAIADPDAQTDAPDRARIEDLTSRV